MTPVNIGIDLGTTNSLIARYENGKVVVLKNPIGHKETLASVVAYRQDRILVGDKARELLTKDAINVFGGFKRKMGTEEKFYVVNIDDNVTPIDLSVLVLKELQKFNTATEVIEAAVITVPASFDSMQSNATIQAGEKAGIKNCFLLQEPIAASLAFFNNQDSNDIPDANWLVYDFGGGTFDVALVKSSNNELKIVDHKGNNFLGGLDLDLAIVNKLFIPFISAQINDTNFEEEVKSKNGKYEKLFYELLYYAEEAKKEISSSQSTIVDMDLNIDGSFINFNLKITNEELDTIFNPIIMETVHLIQQVLTQNHLTAKDISQIILVGGSTYLPQVKKLITAETGIAINNSIDPTTAIVVGATYFAANKYYETTKVAVKEAATDIDYAAEILSSIPFSNVDLDIKLSYAKTSRDAEEVVILFATGDYQNKYYRITRQDGGFDTGLVQMKEKKTEFLPLLSGLLNLFTFSVYDDDQMPINTLNQQIEITQGKFTIEGQPLPQDICIEVDDAENNRTKLEVIFERNTILPQKRTLYREISKTIKKGSSDSILINILEGDRNARPSSNLTIGYIEITGKQLNADIVKGSDIEIQIQITESRALSATIFVVMSQQEFTSTFSISSKSININRLKEQFIALEQELTETVKGFQFNEDKIWEIKAQTFLDALQEIKPTLFKLTEKDQSDQKYIIAERIAQISQESDKLGGNERISVLIEDYLYYKTIVKQNIEMVNFNKDVLEKEYIKMEANETVFMKSKNASFIHQKIEQLNDLNNRALASTTSYLISVYNGYKEATVSEFTSYSSVKALFKMADQSLESEKFAEFRQHVFRISGLMHATSPIKNQEFNGTGIG